MNVFTKAALVGAITYPSLLGVLSLLTGTGMAAVMFPLFAVMGAIAGVWVLLLF